MEGDSLPLTRSLEDTILAESTTSGGHVIYLSNSSIPATGDALVMEAGPHMTPDSVGNQQGAVHVKDTGEERMESAEGMAYLDMNQFMEVVYTYKCKFCAFVGKTPEDMSNHVLTSHMDKFQTTNVPESTSLESELDDKQLDHQLDQEPLDQHEAPAPIGDHVYTMDNNDGDISKDNLQPEQLVPNDGVLLIEDEGGLKESSVPGCDVQHTQTEANQSAETFVVIEGMESGINGSGQSSEGTDYQQIFMCGQCNVSFTTIEECKLHMSEAHNLAVTDIDTEELDLCTIGAPENPPECLTNNISETVTAEDKVSIGTQATLHRKPGRKRKNETEDNTDKTEDLTELLVGADIKEEPIEEEDMAIFSEEFLAERVREGKRRIKIPKILQDDYYVTKSEEYKKRTQTAHSSYRSQPEGRKPNIKCTVAKCTARFHNEESLQKHAKCHQTQENGNMLKGYYCPDCVFSSIQWGPMRLHLWTKHAVDLELLACGQCEYHTDAQHKLSVHKQIHDEERRYTCETCHKAFKQLTQLINHAALHNRNRSDGESSTRVNLYQNRQCHICKRVLCNSKALKKHIEYVHEKVKAYSCQYCGHTAARKHMLQVHLRTHTGERPFKCDMCTFATSDHNTLRRHRLRHTGEKPYKCRFCPYSCIQAISLKIHMKNKHSDTDGLYYCQQCHYHTVNEKSWTQHQLDHENGLIEEHPKYVGDGDNTSTNPAESKTKPTYLVKDLAVLEGLQMTSVMDGVEGPIVQEVERDDASGQLMETGTGEELLALTSDQDAEVQYIYLTEREVSEHVTGLQGTLLVGDTIALDTTSESQNKVQAFQFTQAGTDDTVMFTIQQGSDGQARLVPAEVQHLESTTNSDSFVSETQPVDSSSVEMPTVIL